MIPDAEDIAASRAESRAADREAAGPERFDEEPQDPTCVECGRPSESGLCRKCAIEADRLEQAANLDDVF